MPIFGTEQQDQGGFLQEYTTPTSEVFGLAAEEAFMDNPATKAYTFAKALSADGKILTKAEVEERAKNAGVMMKVPEGGMREDAADLLIGRHYEKKRRQSALEAAEGGFATGALQIAGGLGGSLIDPINVASSFIPVVGQARYAQLLGKAASPLGRAGVRAAVGAAEGAAGAIAVEPLNYGLSKSLGDDYTFSNSLMNIAFGTGMGAGLHAGMGAISEAISKGRPWETAGPRGDIAHSVSKMSPELRRNAGMGAVAQMIEDRPVAVEITRQQHLESLQSRIEAVDAKIAKATALGDQDILSSLQAQKADLTATMQTELRNLGDGEKATALMPEEPRPLMDESVRAEIEKISDPISRDQMVHTQVQSAIDSGLDVRMKVGDERIQIERISEDGKLFDSNGKEVGEATFNRAAEIEVQSGRGTDSSVPVLGDSGVTGSTGLLDPEAKGRALQAAKTEPNSRFYDDETVAQHDVELAEISPEMRVEEANAQMTDALTDLKETAANADLDESFIAKAMEAADEGISAAKEFGKALKAMALCQVRKA